MTTVESNSGNKRNAFLIAIAIHAVILTICFIITLWPPQPPFPEVVTMEVAMADLGNSPDGGGNNPSEDIALPNANTQQHQEVVAPISQQVEQQKEFVTSDDSPVTVNSSTKPVIKPSETAPAVNNTVTAPAPRQANQRALFPGSSGGSNGNSNDGGDGDGKGPGDKGLEDGQPGGKGIGIGNGTWILAGRSLVRAANIETTREEGTIVMKIWVDRRGNVFRAEPILAQCTSTSEYLITKAKKAAMEAQYDVKPDAAPEQVGKMTFKFILK